MLQRLLNRSSDFTLLIFRTILILSLIRIAEYSYFYSVFPDELSLSLFFERSLNYDVLLILCLSAIIFPFYFISSFFTQKSHKLFGIFLFSIVVLDLLLTDFFVLSNFLIPSLFFEFSFDDMIHVTGTEINTNNSLLWIGNILAISLAYYLLLGKKEFHIRGPVVQFTLAFLMLIGFYVGLSSSRFMFRKQKHFDSNFQYYIANSKPVHFFRTWKNWKKTKDAIYSMTNEEFIASIEGFQQIHPENNYLSEYYPLMKRKKKESELSPFFEKSSEKPNIVIVISEGLSSSFSGTKTVYGSLTPFTDSLRAHSLYWESFFSNLDRSASAIPNLLGSLPFGINHRGFINSVKFIDGRYTYPKHINLIHHLKKEGYLTNFYYGGWSGFDNIIHYTRFSEFDLIIDEEAFDDEKYHRSFHELVSWGYDDGQLFERSFEEISKMDTENPFLQMYMTLSYHYPYVMGDSVYFEKSFQDSVMKANKITEEDLGDIEVDEFACLLYADQSLKKLFAHFKKREDFSKTIFIVVGDHGSGIYSGGDKMNSYRVPLIIYSDLLKGSHVFKGTSSHIDVLPSMMRLLENNYNIKAPTFDAFMGEGLDTSKIFRANRMIPLNVLDYDRMNFLLDDLLLVEHEVYRFNEDFKLTPCSNQKDIDRIKKAYNDYLITNNYVISKDRIYQEF